MARTADELLEEEEGEEEVEEEESEDEETVPYNPKNLPLGWDGKVVERNLKREGERERRGKGRGGEGGGGGRESLNSNNTHTLTHTHSHTHTHSPSPTGCTSSMASISPTLVRYVATLHTADQRPSRDTSL